MKSAEPLPTPPKTWSAETYTSSQTSLSPGSLDLVAATAEAAGFVVVDLTWVTDGWDWDDVLVSETDSHPSAWGHELYAEGLLTALKGHSQLRGNLFGYMPLP